MAARLRVTEAKPVFRTIQIDFYADVKAQAMDEATFFQAKASEERIQRAYVTLANREFSLERSLPAAYLGLEALTTYMGITAAKRKAYDKRLRYGSDYESDTEAPVPPIAAGNGDPPQAPAAPPALPGVPGGSARDTHDRKGKGREEPRRSSTADRRSGHERKSSKSKSSRSKRCTPSTSNSEDDSSSDRKASRSNREKERNRANGKGKAREKEREPVRNRDRDRDPDRDRERRRRSSRKE